MTDNVKKMIDGTPVTLVGTLADVEQVYYSTELNQVYVVDTIGDCTKVFTHEEYIGLCDLRGNIEALAKEDSPAMASLLEMYGQFGTELGERLGQFFINNYIKSVEWPSLFHETDDAKAKPTIQKWLDEHQYTDTLPQLLRQERVAQ